MITADTITDEQILALRQRKVRDIITLTLCTTALDPSDGEYATARAICARYLNELPGDVECTVCHLPMFSGDSIVKDSPVCAVHKKGRR